jgi:hypothetical protein
LTDEHVHDTDGFVDGRWVIERDEELRRRTWVRVYPNVELALETTHNKENRYRILKDSLR